MQVAESITSRVISESWNSFQWFEAFQEVCWSSETPLTAAIDSGQDNLAREIAPEYHLPPGVLTFPISVEDRKVAPLIAREQLHSQSLSQGLLLPSESDSN